MYHAKRVYAIVLVLVILLALVVPSVEAGVSLVTDAGTRNGSGAAYLLVSPTIDRVNMRDEPSTAGTVVDIVQTGEVVEVVEPYQEALAKIGTRDVWIHGRTQDGTEGYTAAWLYTIVEIPEPAAAASVAGLYLSPINSGIRIRSAPINGSVLDVTQPGEVVQVIESAPGAKDKIGVPGEWVQVRTSDGVEGYTAAWLYGEADITPPVPEDPVPGTTAETTTIDTETETANETVTELYLTPVNPNINVRSAPVNGSVVSIAATGEVLTVIEPNALDKIGVQGEWIQVRTSNGVEGYTAAWLYSVADTPAEVDTPPDATVASASVADGGGSMTLLPINDGIRIRSEPVNGSVVGVAAANTPVVVVEPVSDAMDKIGVAGEWILVRTGSGIEGYTAAWLYTVDEFAPATAARNASAGIPPLGAVDTNAAPTNNSSISELGIVSVETGVMGPIEPMGSSILALDIDEKTQAAASAVLMPAAGEADDPATVTPVIGPAPVGDLVNNIVPITISLADGSEIETAELSINGYSLDTFSAAPIEYDLDASWLDEGDYRLTFTLTSPNGIVYTDDLYFAVTVEETAAPETRPASPGSNPATLLASDDEAEPATEETVAQRVLLINGEPQPFTFEFSVEDGLLPATLVEETADTTATTAVVAVAEAEKDQSLGDILGKPLTAVVPDPVYKALTVQRPTLAAVLILLMTVTLLPQGVFTLYWMTYTWNNPAIADKYAAPKEFVEPQYSFTAFLPARREEAVIKDTIMAVDRINYPDHLKEILILIRDEDDDGTIAAAQAAIDELGKDNIKLITFTDGPRNKPNGLNKGLKVASNDVVCIFDAEDEPHPEVYNVVNTVMVRDEADVVQSGVQLMNFKSTWFSSFNVLEYFFWFKSGLHAFTHAFNITPLGGNTVFFKRHWMERIGGWDEACLTEDADVGFSLTEQGAKIQIVYEAEYATQEETPDTVESFIKQRTRWCQGFYQIFFKFGWLRLPTLTQKIVALYILLNSLLQAAMIFYLPVGIFIAATQQVPVPVALISFIPIAFLITQMITSLIGIREFASAYGEKLPFGFTLRMMIFYYPYQLLLSVSALRAVYRFLRQQQAWEKTAHSNLHRQSQAAAHQVGVQS